LGLVITVFLVNYTISLSSLSFPVNKLLSLPEGDEDKLVGLTSRKFFRSSSLFFSGEFNLSASEDRNVVVADLVIFL
jgi:hypothetical protein